MSESLNNDLKTDDFLVLANRKRLTSISPIVQTATFTAVPQTQPPSPRSVFEDSDVEFSSTSYVTPPLRSKKRYAHREKRKTARDFPAYNIQEPVQHEPDPVVETPQPVFENVVETPVPVPESVIQTPVPVPEPVIQTPVPEPEPVVETLERVPEPVVETPERVPEPVIDDENEKPVEPSFVLDKDQNLIGLLRSRVQTAIPNHQNQSEVICSSTPNMTLTKPYPICSFPSFTELPLPPTRTVSPPIYEQQRNHTPTYSQQHYSFTSTHTRQSPQYPIYSTLSPPHHTMPSIAPSPNYSRFSAHEFMGQPRPRTPDYSCYSAPIFNTKIKTKARSPSNSEPNVTYRQPALSDHSQQELKKRKTPSPIFDDEEGEEEGEEDDLSDVVDSESSDQSSESTSSKKSMRNDKILEEMKNQHASEMKEMREAVMTMQKMLDAMNEDRMREKKEKMVIKWDERLEKRLDQDVDERLREMLNNGGKFSEDFKIRGADRLMKQLEAVKMKRRLDIEDFVDSCKDWVRIMVNLVSFGCIRLGLTEAKEWAKTINQQLDQPRFQLLFRKMYKTHRPSFAKYVENPTIQVGLMVLAPLLLQIVMKVGSNVTQTVVQNMRSQTTTPQETTPQMQQTTTTPSSSTSNEFEVTAPLQRVSTGVGPQMDLSHATNMITSVVEAQARQRDRDQRRGQIERFGNN